MPDIPSADLPDARELYTTLTALEGRLRESIEAKFKEVKEMFASQQARQDELVRTLATRAEMNEVQTRVTKLEVLLQDHTQLDGHPATLQRLKTAEAHIVELHGRPLKVWQVVATAVLGILAVGGFILNFLSYLHSLAHP